MIKKEVLCKERRSICLERACRVLQLFVKKVKTSPSFSVFHPRSLTKHTRNKSVICDSRARVDWKDFNKHSLRWLAGLFRRESLRGGITVSRGKRAF